MSRGTRGIGVVVAFLKPIIQQFLSFLAVEVLTRFWDRFKRRTYAKARAAVAGHENLELLLDATITTLEKMQTLPKSQTNLALRQQMLVELSQNVEHQEEVLDRHYQQIAAMALLTKIAESLDGINQGILDLRWNDEVIEVPGNIRVHLRSKVIEYG